MTARRSRLFPDSLAGRLLGLLLSLALVVLGFVLLTAALVVGGALALAAVGRLAWLRWTTDREGRRGTIEVEYRVDPDRRSRDRSDPSPVLEGELIVDPEDDPT